MKIYFTCLILLIGSYYALGQGTYKNEELGYEIDLKKAWLVQGEGRDVNILAPRGLLFDSKIEQINIIANYKLVQD